MREQPLGSRVISFEACSAFTARYGLPARQVTWSDPLHRRLRRLRCLCRRWRLLPAGATLCRAGIGSRWTTTPLHGVRKI